MSCIISITAASDQNKVNNSEVVEKDIPVADFYCTMHMHKRSIRQHAVSVRP